jgi:short-subunit dehydrogenase
VYPGATDTSLVRRGYATDAAKQAKESALLARGLSPATVARRIVRGVERGRARVLVGRDTRLIDLATRLAPGLVQAALRRSWRRVPFL